MKKNVVNASVEVMQSVTESKQTKGFKAVNSENATIVQPSVKDTKNAFIAFIRTKEEIGLNKFFKLFEAFKKDSPKAYGEFLAANNLDFSLDYSFKWFAANCPSMEIDGKKEFAKWVKVTENTPANEKEEYNRFTEKGVQQTLKAYYCTRANYEQYLSMFMDVIREIKRAKRLAEKARKEGEKAKKQNEKLLKSSSEMFAEIDTLSKDFSLPFETAVSVYAKTKGFAVSSELKAMLLQRFEETKKAAKETKKAAKETKKAAKETKKAAKETKKAAKETKKAAKETKTAAKETKTAA